MTKKEILDDLFHRRRFNIKPGLERTLALAEYVDNPHKKYKSIHISGTNGKGSTATITASAIKSAGYKTALYTSPHIKEFNERILVDGKPISDDDLVRLVEPLIKKADEIGATFFEITTVLAFLYFAEQGVDYAVIECGMGGRYDSTNIIQPQIACMTAIAMDHSEYLGSTIEEITIEKAGIIKDGIPAVISYNAEEVRKTVKQKIKDSELIFLDEKCVISDYNFDRQNVESKVKLNYKNEEIELIQPFIGKHQSRNLANAYAIFKLFAKQNKISNTDTHKLFKIGCEKVHSSFPLHGRMEILQKSPLIIADGGHNPDAAIMLAKTLKQFDEKFTFVFAAMGDKDIENTILALIPHSKRFILPNLEYSRAAKNTKIAELLEKNGYHNFELKKTVANAIDQAKSYGDKIVICGSFFLLAEM